MLKLEPSNLDKPNESSTFSLVVRVPPMYSNCVVIGFFWGNSLANSSGDFGRRKSNSQSLSLSL